MSDEPEAELADDDAPDAPASDADAAPEEPADASEDAADAGIQEGDFVRLSYTIRTVDDDMLVDTTDEDLAEEEGIDTEDQDFEPRTLVIGAGHVFDVVEDDLKGKEIGSTGSVEIPAVDAFGEHDSEQVRTVSADRIPEEERHPGGHVDIDGQHGHVETIIGGRARVDFNHPLAGEDILYDYEILDVVEDRLERAQGLLDVYLDIDLDMHFETEEEEHSSPEDEETEVVEVETLYIESTPQLAMNQQWLFQKQQIAQELIDRVGVDRVVVREILDGTGGMMGGLGGMGGIEDAIEDIDEDIDADDLVEELEEETDLDAGDLPSDTEPADDSPVDDEE